MIFSNLNSNFYKKFFFSLLSLFFLVTSLPAQELPQEVVAKPGDGIYLLLKRHGLSANDLKDFIELNRRALGPNNTLISGRKYKLPQAAQSSSSAPADSAAPAASTGEASAGVVRKFEIFGKKYENVTIKNQELKGAIYYLVSGHGGPDPGAIGKYGGHTLSEDEYAYDVTLRLARNLIESGATVYIITRDPNDGIRDESFLKLDKDEVCYPNQTIPLNQLQRLKQRTTAVNNLFLQNRGSFQRMICIHVDARSRGENIDVFFYHDERSKTGSRAANILKNTFLEKYNHHQPNRGYKGTVSHRNLYEVRNSLPVTVYIELGNINHSRDIQRLIIADNRQALANWLTAGLIRDFNTNK